MELTAIESPEQCPKLRSDNIPSEGLPRIRQYYTQFDSLFLIALFISQERCLRVLINKYAPLYACSGLMMLISVPLNPPTYLNFSHLSKVKHFPTVP